MMEPPWDFILYMAAMIVPMVAMLIWAWPVFKRQAEEMEEYRKEAEKYEESNNE